MDKIIHYVNVNAAAGGPVVAFYSTPSHYTDAKHAETVKNSATWELRSDDIFPLGDNAHVRMYFCFPSATVSEFDPGWVATANLPLSAVTAWWCYCL